MIYTDIKILQNHDSPWKINTQEVEDHFDSVGFKKTSANTPNLMVLHINVLGIP